MIKVIGIMSLLTTLSFAQVFSPKEFNPNAEKIVCLSGNYETESSSLYAVIMDDFGSKVTVTNSIRPSAKYSNAKIAYYAADLVEFTFTNLETNERPVSYTHLTLPTIYSV